MGIPSYYKKLARTVNGFYCDAPQSVDYFLMDYNCLIYQVLRSMPAFTESDPLGYESLLVERTWEYTSILIDMVKPKHTYIALDGVVPLAKMKQQRMRRFRAIELAAEERKLGLRSGPSWDTNAITPGTAFMNHLAIKLRIRFPEATIISDTSEPGEGEHKVMRFMRNTPPNSKHAIYGLDGDLFVLALLNQQVYVPDASIYFFREEVNRDNGQTEYVWLALDRLKVALLAESEGASDAKTWLTEYALAMSLLGNDFVPQSLAFRIKEGGHERLIKYLKRLHGAGQRLLGDTGLDWNGWQQIFRWLANEEEMRIEQAIEKKRISRRTQVGESATDALRAKINDRPLEWFAEADGQLWNEGSLVPNWRDRYAEIGLGSPEVSVSPWYHKVAATRYLESIDWVYQYYIGDPSKVDWDWMYEFNSAPLFEYVANGAGAPKPHMALKGPQGPPPTPHEQLALVLPRESYRLIPKCKERNFLHRAPEYFPQKWSYFHFGKRFFWECEAHIPVPTIRFLRHVLTGH